MDIKHHFNGVNCHPQMFLLFFKNYHIIILLLEDISITQNILEEVYTKLLIKLNN
jgi:hypothetical protein